MLLEAGLSERKSSIRIVTSGENQLSGKKEIDEHDAEYYRTV